jgi:hypothetical protein
MSRVYIPKHQRQLVADKYGGVNCTAYSAAMAIDRATLGGVYVTGKTVRGASNEPIPDPQSPGLNLPQIVNVAFGWHVELVNRAGAPWASVMAALREGRGVVLQGDYDQIPLALRCQASFTGDHAIYVNHISGDGDLYWMDPLCAKGKEINWAVGRAYAEKFARTIGTYPGVAFATTRITPLIA